MDYSNTPFYFKDLCESISLKTLHIKNPCIELKASKNLTELKGAKRANLIATSNLREIYKIMGLEKFT